jgi:hypothetical protein
LEPCLLSFLMLKSCVAIRWTMHSLILWQVNPLHREISIRRWRVVE